MKARLRTDDKLVKCSTPQQASACIRSQLASAYWQPGNLVQSVSHRSMPRHTSPPATIAPVRWCTVPELSTLQPPTWRPCLQSTYAPKVRPADVPTAALSPRNILSPATALLSPPSSLSPATPAVALSPPCVTFLALTSQGAAGSDDACACSMSVSAPRIDCWRAGTHVLPCRLYLLATAVMYRSYLGVEK